jgi:hypothetical protein
MAITTQGASYPLESFGPTPPLSQGTGGYQLGAGNLNEPLMFVTPVPATATASATLTASQALNGILLGSPGGTAASYQLPTVTTLEAGIPSAAGVGDSFDFSVMNVDGTGTGVITLTTNTGWTLVGLMTVAATAGTSQMFRARKTGSGTWTLYRIA